MQSASGLADSALDWLRDSYASFVFFVERDIVWTLQTRIRELIKSQGLPYRVLNDYPIVPGTRGSQCTDLAILGTDGTIEVAMEFKYEPSHQRTDIPSSKFPVVFWGADGVGKDVNRVRKYVATGRAREGISVFVDEGGSFAHRVPHPGARWIDWGHGRKVLYSRFERGSDAITEPASRDVTAQALPLQTTGGARNRRTLERGAVSEFVNQEDLYLRWLGEHPGGFIINTSRSKNPKYMMLHRSWCPHISQYNQMSRPGGFTTRDYIKICSPTRAALEEWVRRNGRPDGSFSGECPCLWAHRSSSG